MVTYETIRLWCLKSVHGIIQNLFRVGRHLLRARAFVAWNAVTCA